MDPITALGCASSILSFVDFATKLIKGACIVYASGGSTAEHRSLSRATTDLKDLTAGLKFEFLGQTPNERALRALADDCQDLSGKLNIFLRKVQTSGKKSAWASIKASWSSARYDAEIQSLDDQLNRHRVECLLRLQLILCERQSSVVSRLDQIQAEGVKLSRETSRGLGELRDTIADELHKRRSSLDPNYLRQSSLSGGPPILSGAPPAIQYPNEHSHTHEDVNDLESLKLVLLSLKSKLQLISKENRLLSHLVFDSIYSREDSILDAEFGTFDWILQEPEPRGEESTEDLRDWRRLPSATPSAAWKKSYAVDTYQAKRNSHTLQRPRIDYAQLSAQFRGGKLIAPGAPIPKSPRPGSVAQWPGSETRFAPDPSSYADIEDAARSKARRAFRTWLREEDTEVFHISGRPGTGKSTLMKFLSQHPKTVTDLEEWAGDKRLVLARFFFYNSGDQLQMSLDGLYRSVLFETLRDCPELISQVFPEQWALFESSGPGSIALERLQFRPTQIEAAFRTLIEKFDLSGNRLCVFIDGLDEFKGDSEDHYQLAKSIQQWSQSVNVKICVSSRPYNEFIFVFSNSPDLRIHLHDITKPDIYVFTRDAFESCPDLDRVSPDMEYLDIVDEIVEQSDGVFLWARLVVRLLLRSIRRHDSIQRLKDILRVTPRDLNKLYSGIIDSIDDADRVRRDQMLLITALNPFPSPLNALAYTWLDELELSEFPTSNAKTYTRDEILHRHDRIKLQLNSLTNGLVEVISIFNDDEADGVLFFSKRVQCFHRTVIDYIRDKSMIEQLSSDLPHLLDMDSFAKLRLAEFVLADPNEIVGISDNHANQLLDELFEQSKNPTARFYREKSVSASLMENFKQFVESQGTLVLLGEPRQLFYGTLYDTYVSSRCLDVHSKLSFVHYASYQSHFEYIQNNLDRSGTAMSSNGELNLLLSALIGGDIKLVGWLLEYGFSKDDEVIIRTKTSSRSAEWNASRARVWVLYTVWLWCSVLSERNMDVKYWLVLDSLVPATSDFEPTFVLQRKFQGAEDSNDSRCFTLSQLRFDARPKDGYISRETTFKDAKTRGNTIQAADGISVNTQPEPNQSDEVSRQLQSLDLGISTGVPNNEKELKQDDIPSDKIDILDTNYEVVRVSLLGDVLLENAHLIQFRIY